MLLSSEIKISWGNRNKKYYTEKGYIFTKLKDEFIVKLEDASIGSRGDVVVLCDYCKINTITLPYNEYNKRKQKDVNKDCCLKCASIKIKESCISKYGVEHNSKIKEVIEKQRQTKKDRYIKKYTIDIGQLNSKFNEKNYTLLTNSCVDYNSILTFICNKHKESGEQIISYRNFQRSDTLCKECLKEKCGHSLRFSYEYAKEVFTNAGLNLLDQEYFNANRPLFYVCPIHNQIVQKISLSHLKDGQGCGICRYDKIRGENNRNWKGGITSIHVHIRGHILQWKKDSMKNCGFKCVITGKRFDDIHHLYSFNLILDEAMRNLNIEYKETVSDYSEVELQLLIKNIKILHNIYPMGVCLIKDLHRLFHVLYSYGNNIPSQFEEFKNRLKSGEFNQYIEDNNIRLAI